MPSILHMSETVVPYAALAQRIGRKPFIPSFRRIDPLTAEGYVPAWVSLHAIEYWTGPLMSDTRDVTIHVTRVTAIPDRYLQKMEAQLPPEAAPHVYHVEPMRLTVHEVITLLAQQPPDALVYLEGCDCEETMGGLTFNAKDHSVLLERT
jgi:hypothetical protein